MPRLTAAQRKKLPPSEFGVPKLRKYPIDTKRRAKSALSRVVQHGNGPEIHQVRERVHRRFPSIEVSGLTGKPTKRGRR